MPFPDEPASSLAIVTYDRGWPWEFCTLAANCIDIQIRVYDLDDNAIPPAFTTIGFRLRPEPWNRVEVTAGTQWPKLVFAPPIGERATNVHVRESDSATARRNLLFRDFLRANDPARNAWGDFKQRLAHSATNIYDYGQIKSPATEILMIAAEDWARHMAWKPAR
ncbi:MAG: GrpB family protein [Pseudonocardiaceae bacterium]